MTQHFSCIFGAAFDTTLEWLLNQKSLPVKEVYAGIKRTKAMPAAQLI